MAEISQSAVIEKLIKGLGLQTGKDKIPTEILDKIQPVFNAEPDKIIKIKNITLADTASGTIHTTSSTRRTFVVGVYLSVSKDAVNDATYSQITGADVLGTTRTFIRKQYEPTTAGQFDTQICLPYGVEMKKGTNISLTNSAATASIDTSAIVYYYEVDEV